MISQNPREQLIVSVACVQRQGGALGQVYRIMCGSSEDIEYRWQVICVETKSYAILCHDQRL